MILLVGFQVHFWLPLSKRTYLKGSSGKRAHQQRTLGGWCPLCPPAPEGLWRGFVQVVQVVQDVLFTVVWFKWSVKKSCMAKVLLAVWGIFLYEYNRNYHSYRFSCKFTFILLLSFPTNQKQESGFQQVDCLVTRNISVFCL